ncbi:choice-of-anchor I family protein [Brunnivagina elsteri]|uniref:Bifunctional metallophosphatase/5'-nucleotidase n=1 Tax=Brunnivagina elsteri CCALA 953 TaxID=987040 RepID=A0A2A2THM3_9CYAN|nr:choice-of-anchor I family protein [Calothrix elsteri]PAX53222.1 bifunctional metallophosphatase/5'-nucleotidase [Calothrix elsteri CCALA 953]
MSNQIQLKFAGTLGLDGAEISDFDPKTKRLFTTGEVAGKAVLQITDISDPTKPTKIGNIDLSSFGAGIQSVAVRKGKGSDNSIVAIAISATTATDPGKVVFFDATVNVASPTALAQVTVGALPDMLTFSPDGTKVLVANEGEPNEGYTVDPEGSISIIDVSGSIAALDNTKVSTATFTAFNSQEASLKQQGVRIFGKLANGTNSTVAQDVEPEYITFSGDGKTAFVTLQENNALAKVDIATATITAILPLGYKDHSLPGNGIDASDRDVNGTAGGGGKINIQNYPVFGMYQPDAIASFESGGKTYYVTANEGDSRIRPTASGIISGQGEGGIFNEEARVSTLNLDSTAFPNATTLKNSANLGRLTVTNKLGDTDGDGDYDKLYAYGARSFSVWDDTGKLVFDSGDQLEQITAQQTPTFFNANNGLTTDFDTRSDNKGPEPESVVVGYVSGKPYAFIGLERAGGGVMVYDLSNPTKPEFVQYIRTATDISPEGLKFISASDSPNGKPLLAVSNEVSNTATLYEIAAPNFTLQLLHAADQEAGINALDDAPRFSAVLNALKNQDANKDGKVDYGNTITLSSGDAYIPGLFLDAAKDPSLAPLLGKEGVGRADIIIQNELGFQAIAFGNHEFDLGTGVVKSVLSPDGAYPGAKFPYLSSNLNFAPDTNLAGLVTAEGQEASSISGKITKSTVVTVNGEKIGVVGATTPTLRSISSPGNVGVLPTNPTDIAALAAEIQKSVDALKAQGINKIVLLAHMQQIAIEQQLAGLLKDVDIIMAGGSNTRLVDATDRLRTGDSKQGDYPILTKSATGEDMVIINTDGNYKYVGRLVVDFDAQGKIVPGSINPNVSGAYATDAQGVAALNAQNLVDPEVKAITDALRQVIVKQDGNFFGTTTEFLNGTRSDVRTQETNLGNLTADANLDYGKRLDPTVVVSIKNGGGIRNDIGRVFTPTGAIQAVKLAPEGNPLSGKPEGGISQPDLQNALSFNNALTLVTVTAEQLKQVLEHGVAATASGATPGQFPQIAGVSFSFDSTKAAGQRIQNAAILNDDGTLREVLVKDGQVQGNKNRGIRIVTLGFLADGGDNYPLSGFIAANPTFANRVDLIGETDKDLNLNGKIDAPIDAKKFDLGKASFANSGTEQDAFAEYLVANFANSPFNSTDTAPALDTRIQRLDARADGVFAKTTIESATPGVVGIKGGSGVNQLRFSVNQSNSSTTVNELVVFESDGSTNPDLKQLLLSGKAKVISSAVGNKPTGFNPDLESRTLGFAAGSKLGFALIKDGTADDIQAGKSKEIVFSTKTNFVTNISGNGFNLAIDGFNVKAESVNEARPLGTGLQNKNDGELIDLRDISGKVEATFSMYREAAFNNQIYFYKLDNADGLVGGVNPGTGSNYLNSALANIVTGADGKAMKLEVANQGTATIKATVNAGSIIAPFIVVNGTLEQLQDTNPNNNPVVYFPFLGANPGQFDHIRLLGDNTFGFEDLPGGGDKDYNDIIVKVNLAPVV